MWLCSSCRPLGRLSWLTRRARIISQARAIVKAIFRGERTWFPEVASSPSYIPNPVLPTSSDNRTQSMNKTDIRYSPFSYKDTLERIGLQKRACQSPGNLYDPFPFPNRRLGADPTQSPHFIVYSRYFSQYE
jgi:hypothetical protein